jgi:hypothetical protein
MFAYQAPQLNHGQPGKVFKPVWQKLFQQSQISVGFAMILIMVLTNEQRENGRQQHENHCLNQPY